MCTWLRVLLAGASITTRRWVFGLEVVWQSKTRGTPCLDQADLSSGKGIRNEFRVDRNLIGSIVQQAMG